MPQLHVSLKFPITDLAQELRGYHAVRFLDWEPDVYLSYSLGNKKSVPIRKGMKVRVTHNFLLYNFSSRHVTLTLEVE